MSSQKERKQEKKTQKRDFNTARISRRMKPDINALIENCPKFIKTGFPELDALLGGGLTPNLFVLGAISSLGKSTFLLQMAQNIALERPVLYFSLEMSAYRHAEKAVMRQLHLDIKGKKDVPQPDAGLLTDAEKLGQLDPDMKGYLVDAVKTFNERTENLYIIDREGEAEPFTAQRIEQYIHDFYYDMPEEQHMMPVVIVDYLQLLRSQNPNYSGTERQLVDESIAKLWHIAHFAGHVGTPVIVISSINRDSYAKPISFSAFKESGSIEFSADIVLGMQYRNVGQPDFDFHTEVAKDARELELVLLKNRYGPGQVSCYFNFEPAYSNFEEVEKKTLKKASPKRSTGGKKRKSGEETPIVTDGMHDWEEIKAVTHGKQ